LSRLRDLVSKALEHLDLVAATVLAVIAVVADFIPGLPQSLATDLLPPILALLAISLIRLQRSVLRLQSVNAPQYLPFASGPQYDIERMIRTAVTITLTGLTLTRTLKNHMRAFHAALGSGLQLQVLLPEPDGPTSALLSSRESHSQSKERFALQLSVTLNDLRVLQQKYPENVEIRTTAYPFSFGAILVNRNRVDAALHLRYYTYRSKKLEGPYFSLTGEDDPWFTHFKEEVEQLWATAEPAVPEDSEAGTG
jgi:hypothetical protein